jgi:hypothetical protein
MSGDTQMETAFEVADDGMQGLIGYFYYVCACQKTSRRSSITRNLPNWSEHQPAIRITTEWVRHYNPKELRRDMETFFPLYHARVALVSLISIFESSLASFNARLKALNIAGLPRRNFYKTRLEWAFSIAKDSKTMLNTKSLLTDICLDVDHARRIRNLWMHNKGLFDPKYENGITVDGRAPIRVPEYDQWKIKRTPLAINILPETFLRLSVAHITLLHHVHSAIQTKFFDPNYSYSYKGRGKRINRSRILAGV